MKLWKIFLIAFFLPILLITACGEKTDEITVISREDGSGTRGVFSEVFGLIEKSGEGEIHDTTYREAVVTSKTDIVLTNVEGDINAIGYVSAGTLSDRVKEIAIDGVMPTAENIRAGIYPAARSFNLAVLPEKCEKINDFISFILSREGQKLVSQNYVSVETSEAYSGNFNGKITVAGSSSVTPLMERLSEEYMKLNPNADIEIQMSDSSSGISGAAEGICDIGMSSRQLTKNELKKLKSIKIASDGIAVVVNRKNPINSISSEDIRKIYRGETVNWSFLK